MAVASGASLVSVAVSNACVDLNVDKLAVHLAWPLAAIVAGDFVPLYIMPTIRDKGRRTS